MLNLITSYTECGTRAAIAQNQKDAGRYDHEKRWLSKALALEKPEAQKVARAAYDTAYTAARNIPKPEPFI